MPLKTSPLIGAYSASDGYRLHYRQYVPADAPRAQIVAMHGIQSHGGWYHWSSSQLCDAGYQVFFLDRRGSGMNEPGRGDAPSADQLVSDVTRFLSRVRDCHADPTVGGNVPTILLAISWSGKLAATVAAHRPELVDGLALLYPGICAKVQATWLQRQQLRLALRLGLHDKRVPIPLRDPALFTSDPDWQEFIRHDPLALHEVTLSFLQAHLELDARALAAPAAISAPTLLMLAGRDQIIDNLATRDYFTRLATTQKELVEYPDAQHTLEFEPARDQFLADLLRWLDHLVKAYARSHRHVD